MSKQVVKIELAYVSDPKQIMKFVGVLDSGRLTQDEMYGIAREYQDGSLNHYPFILEAETDECEDFTVSWGYYNNDTVKITFAPRPLLVGQEVIRTDYDEKQPSETTYKIVEITVLI